MLSYGENQPFLSRIMFGIIEWSLDCLQAWSVYFEQLQPITLFQIISGFRKSLLSWMVDSIQDLQEFKKKIEIKCGEGILETYCRMGFILDHGHSWLIGGIGLRLTYPDANWIELTFSCYDRNPHRWITLFYYRSILDYWINHNICNKVPEFDLNGEWIFDGHIDWTWRLRKKNCFGNFWLAWSYNYVSFCYHRDFYVQTNQVRIRWKEKEKNSVECYIFTDGHWQCGVLPTLLGNLLDYFVFAIISPALLPTYVIYALMMMMLKLGYHFLSSNL